jgi:predicted MPP superfamily phosphohydrolase
MNDRFSRANILATVQPYQYSKRGEIFREFVGYLIDWGPVLAIILWIILGIVININPLLFYFGLITLIGFSLWFLYIYFKKYYSIKIKKYEIPIKGLTKDIKFVFISDIHTGIEHGGTNKQRTKIIVDAINSLKSELVIFGGDFVTEDYHMDILNLLKQVEAPLKVGVYGNHDSLYLEDKQTTQFPIAGVEKLKSLDINILCNEGRAVNLNGISIFIGGINDMYSRNFDAEKAFDKSKSEQVKILISHNPDIIDFLKEDDDIDLVLSGHNHAGQIRLPIIGNILPMPSKHKWLTKGVFNIVGKTKLLLSQGAGYSKTRIRIGTECEICYITLTEYN